ncbi:hypothetical protein H4R20_000464 [Coemansia guatemalensis]|uniref:GH18 domain-containing protein n=1 Tax=Coemansia guatemalensis TaxID=2761395 RepID=A0A9W8I570_9FUNG|nr:hypothetical protein H4R20_000464 [Coemansia guatemalensis]
MRLLLKSLAASALLLLLSASRGVQANDTGNAATPRECGPSSRLVVAYYPTWKHQSLMNIDWSRITHLHLAYAIPTDSGDITFDGEWFLPQLVREAHKADTKVLLSVGGWTGSNRFSLLMRDAHKRAALTRSISGFLEKYELDGVDLDWEYVGKQGSKCNKFSPADDSSNMLRFLRAMRASISARFDSSKLLSLAVPVRPFENAEGPLKDVSPFAEFADYASILAFDINGPWSNSTGPNAPLHYETNRGAPYSLSQSVDAWLNAKWPADKLVAGVSFQGRSLTTRGVLTAKEGAEMYTSFTKDIPQGDAEDSLWYDVCENSNAMSGVWQYKHLRDQGILKSANTTGDEWVRVWDEQSKTPWLYNPQMRRFISYDDPQSVEKKVEFAKEKGLKGMMAWSLHADYNNELLSVLSRVGPLCRGPKSDKDHQESETAHTSSTSSSSSWTPSPPFTSQPTPDHSTAMSSTSETSFSSNDVSSTTSSAEKSEESAATSASETSAESPAPSSESIETAASATSSSLSESTEEHQSTSMSELESTSTGKSILFDSLGAPYMMVDGHSTAVPADLAEKLLQVAQPTSASSTNSDGNLTDSTSGTSVNSSALPTAPLAMPVVDGPNKSHGATPTTRLSITGPNKPALSIATDLFSTAALGVPTHHSLGALSSEHGSRIGEASVPDVSLAPTSPSGFAATFLLPLDTNSQSGGMQTTTVVPLSQMMETTKSSAGSKLTSDSQLTERSSIATSDPLATSADSSTATSLSAI